MGQIFVNTFNTMYYDFIIALTVFYFLQSFQSPLPWTSCDSDWADKTTCYDTDDLPPCPDKFQNETIPTEWPCDRRPVLQSSAEQYYL